MSMDDPEKELAKRRTAADIEEVLEMHHNLTGSGGAPDGIEEMVGIITDVYETKLEEIRESE